MTKSLFPELDFTRQNVLNWAITQGSLPEVLREALSKHYLRIYSQYDKSDLVEAIMFHVNEGVDKPVNVMTTDELLGEIMTLCTPSEEGENAFELETMDDFVRVFVNGEW